MLDQVNLPDILPLRELTVAEYLDRAEVKIRGYGQNDYQWPQTPGCARYRRLVEKRCSSMLVPVVKMAKGRHRGNQLTAAIDRAAISPPSTERATKPSRGRPLGS